MDLSLEKVKHALSKVLSDSLLSTRTKFLLQFERRVNSFLTKLELFIEAAAKAWPRTFSNCRKPEYCCATIGVEGQLCAAAGEKVCFLLTNECKLSAAENPD